MMKKVLIGLLAVAMLCSGCGKGGNEAPVEGNTGGSGEGSVTVDKIVEEVVGFDEEKVLSGLNTTTYTWNDDYGNYLALVVKNNSNTDCELTVDVTFKDAEGNLVGATDGYVDAFGVGGEVCFVFDNEDEFDTFTYEYSANELEYYDAVDSDLALETSVATEKVIISVTNNGEKAAEFVEYIALFMEGDKVVEYDWGYVGDDDSEIKPGKTENEEAMAWDDFESVKVFISGRAEK